MKGRFAALILVVAAVSGCHKKERLVFGADTSCYPPTGPMPNGAILGHWFAEDRRAHRKTFGFTPPDSSSVSPVLDSALSYRINAALDSALPGTPDPTAPKSQSFVYRAGGMYALVDIRQEVCGGDAPFLPMVFFVDTSLRYLGERSN